VAGFLGKKQQSIIWGQNCLKQVPDGPLDRETAVADSLETLENMLSFESFDHGNWIRRQWVEMVSKKCASDVWEVRKRRMEGNKWEVTHWRARMGTTARGNLPEVPYTTFMVVIYPVRNGNNDQISSIQLHASYRDVRRWDELINFIEEDCHLKQPYCLTAIYQCNLT